MFKFKNVGFLFGLLVILAIMVGYGPSAALASIPLGITPTATEEATATPEDPTATPTTEITVVPPLEDTPTPTPTLTPTDTPPPGTTPPATEPPGSPPRRATPTGGALVLPVTGDLPPDSGFTGVDAGTLAALFLALAGVLFFGYRLGIRLRR